jgi:uncharacterized phage protein (TIGR01671 family)
VRDIKFRVWDNLAKKWLTKKVYHASLILDDNGVGEFTFKQHPEGFTIEQYTGLKDKNGKEIYENDIVVGSGGKFASSLSTIVKNPEDYVCEASVNFYKGSFMLNHYPLMDYTEFEVIGNIHEYPKQLNI